jgi:hypothetical protein
MFGYITAMVVRFHYTGKPAGRGKAMQQWS